MWPKNKKIHTLPLYVPFTHTNPCSCILNCMCKYCHEGQLARQLSLEISGSQSSVLYTDRRRVISHLIPRVSLRKGKARRLQCDQASRSFKAARRRNHLKRVAYHSPTSDLAFLVMMVFSWMTADDLRVKASTSPATTDRQAQEGRHWEELQWTLLTALTGSSSYRLFCTKTGQRLFSDADGRAKESKHTQSQRLLQ